MKNMILLTLGGFFVYLGVSLIGKSLNSEDAGGGDLARSHEPYELEFDPEAGRLIKEKSWDELVARVSSLPQPQRSDFVAKALAQYEMGLYDSVLKTTDDLMQGDMAEALLRRLRVMSLIRRGELDKAESHLPSWRKAYPRDGNLYYAEGYCLWKRKKIAQSAPFFAKALELGCQEKNLRMQLTDIYFYLGKEAEDGGKNKAAIDYLEKALTLDPPTANYDYRLGKLYVSTKQKEKALRLFKNSLSKEMDQQLEEAIYDEIRLIYHDRAFKASIEKQYQQALEWARLERQYVKVKSHGRSVDRFIENNSKLYVEELRARARKSVDNLEIWKEILTYQPADPEARWEASRTLPVEERLLVEQALLRGAWEAEACRRRSEEFWKNKKVEEACRWMIRHHQMVKGRDKMAAEQKLFVWLRVLDNFGLQMNSKSWEHVWRLFRLEAGSDKWGHQMQQVNRLFPERYFIWMYQAEVLLNQGELNKFKQLADEIVSLDPPRKAMVALEQLRERSLLPK